MSAIEDLIYQQAPLSLVLRLLCLASITSGGIKVKTLENIKREILQVRVDNETEDETHLRYHPQTYGYELLPLLLSLSSLGLLLPNPLPKSQATTTASTSLKPPPPPPPFAPVRKAFRILSESPEANPTDVSYVYSGYAPISIRLVQAVAMKGSLLANLTLVNPPEGDATGVKREPRVERVAAHPITGWKGFDDAVKTLPGAVVDEVQKGSSQTACECGLLRGEPWFDFSPPQRPIIEAKGQQPRSSSSSAGVRTRKLLL